MTYRVFWFPEADRYLDKLLEGAEKREEFGAAAAEINLHLTTDPFDFGESRYERVRIGFAGSLAVLFEVLRDVNTVIVFHVWRTDRNRR